jgi:hypothetical protein
MNSAKSAPRIIPTAPRDERASTSAWTASSITNGGTVSLFEAIGVEEIEVSGYHTRQTDGNKQHPFILHRISCSAHYRLPVDHNNLSVTLMFKLNTPETLSLLNPAISPSLNISGMKFTTEHSLRDEGRHKIIVITIGYSFAEYTMNSGFIEYLKLDMVLNSQ